MTAVFFRRVKQVVRRFPVPELGNEKTDMSKVHKVSPTGPERQCVVTSSVCSLKSASSTIFGSPLIPGVTSRCTTSAS